MIVLKQFLPLVLSQLTLGCLLKKVNTPARNLPVPAKGQVIAMEGSGLGPLKVVLLSVGLVQNSAAGMRGRISARECRI